MRWIAMVLMALLATTGSASEIADQQASLSVFVGRLVSIRELPDPCPPLSADNETMCISMDALYEATYEVKRAISGTATSGNVTFKIADHYGFPRFARYHHALLFVQLTPDGAYLDKYQGFDVHETASGDWASCGLPDEGKVEDPELIDVTFASHVNFGSVGHLTKAAVLEEFPADTFRIRNGIAYCRKGVLADEFVEWWLRERAPSADDADTQSGAPD